MNNNSEVIIWQRREEKGGRGELYESIVIIYFVLRFGEYYMRFKVKGYFY